jgi:uncharacterized OsmC-like protein
MSDGPFSVVASSGDLRPSSHGGVEFGHHWTPEGVVAQSDFTGAHLLHLAVAGCVLNDVHREAERLGMTVDGVRVAAWGDFDRETWQSTGISYSVEVSSPASAAGIEELLRIVDDVAEIPRALRSQATVERR